MCCLVFLGEPKSPDKNSAHLSTHILHSLHSRHWKIQFAPPQDRPVSVNFSSEEIFFPTRRFSLLFTSTGFFPSAAENLAFKVFPLQRKKEQEETFYDFHTTKLDGRTSDHFFLFSVCIQHECYYGANQPFRRSLVFSLELSQKMEIKKLRCCSSCDFDVFIIAIYVYILILGMQIKM